MGGLAGGQQRGSHAQQYMPPESATACQPASQPLHSPSLQFPAHPTSMASNLLSDELLLRVTCRGELTALPQGCAAQGRGRGTDEGLPPARTKAPLAVCLRTPT